jgi:amino acid transporter
MMTAEAKTVLDTDLQDARQQSRGLAKNRVGVLGIVFFVIAAAAPLTVVVALFPVILVSGNGIGIAGTFVLVSLVLLLFSVGFVAMSRHITNTGAFYSYITQGLGRPMGLGAASMVIFSYNAIQLGLYGGIGYYAEAYVSSRIGVHLPWWLYSFAALFACLMLGIRRIEAGAAVLAVLLTLETGIIMLLDGSILWHQGAAVAHFSFAPFFPKAVLAGSLGVALMFAHASFIGFEGTAIYGARHLHRGDFHGRLLLAHRMVDRQQSGRRSRRGGGQADLCEPRVRGRREQLGQGRRRDISAVRYHQHVRGHSHIP